MGLETLGAIFGYAMAFDPPVGDYRVTFYKQNSGCVVVNSRNRSNLANSPRCSVEAYFFPKVYSANMTLLLDCRLYVLADLRF